MNIYPQFVKTLHICTPIIENIYENIKTAFPMGICRLNIDKHQITLLDTSSIYWPAVNSFVPLITISLQNGENPIIKIESKLQKPTQILLSIIWAIAVAFEILLIVKRLSGQVISLFPLLIPIIVLTLSYLLSIIVLWFSSKYIFQKIEFVLL